MEELLRIFNIERFGTEDGPGIRTVVFLKGCLLRCRWCANPESQLERSQILLKTNVCVNCGRCERLCPQKAIHYAEGYGYLSDPEKCSLCGTCVEECLLCARERMGKSVTPDELVDEIRWDAAYYRSSGGGVTFSGGEPALQARAVAETAEKLKEEGITTWIETCGDAPLAMIQMLASQADGFFYDIKQMDAQKHKALTGRDNIRILENLSWLKKNFDGALTVRYPCIPGCNDSSSDIEAFFTFAAEQGFSEVVFLPYHRLGIDKYKGLGRKYAMGDRPSLKKADLIGLREIGERYSVCVTIQ